MFLLLSILGALLMMVVAPSGCAWPGSNRSGKSANPPFDKLEIRDHRLQLLVGPPLAYRTFQPISQPASGLIEHKDQDPPWIILAHGFLRNQGHMRGLAIALADAGFPVATLNSRHDSPFSGGHLAHSRDMRELAGALGAQRVIYAGFSAGALAALLAARKDPAAMGVLTLDLVDSQDLGRQAAAGLQAPLIALTGAPTNCNAYNNAAPVYQSASSISLTPFPQASHCDFESPSDWLCLVLCEQPQASADKHDIAVNPQPDIIQAAVAGVRQLVN